jgi:hypothetical protein
VTTRRAKVAEDRRSARTLTGDDVRLMRTVRLGWSVQEFAALLDVALSAIGRWERCGESLVVADRHFYNLLLVLNDVLDNVPGAADTLSRVKNSGAHRGLFVLFGMHFGDTPWVDAPRKAITKKTRIKKS